MTQLHDDPPPYSTGGVADYIASRPPPDGLVSDNAVVHQLQLGERRSPSASSLRFPRPEHVWMSRDVDRDDWGVFTKQVVASATTNARDKKAEASLDIDEPARRDHIIGVVTEWNKHFFSPRGLKVLPLFGDEVGIEEPEQQREVAGSNTTSNTSRGYGLKLGKNSLLGVSLPPNSNGFGLRLGGVLLGVKVGDDDESKE